MPHTRPGGCQVQRRGRRTVSKPTLWRGEGGGQGDAGAGGEGLWPEAAGARVGPRGLPVALWRVHLARQGDRQLRTPGEPPSIPSDPPPGPPVSPSRQSLAVFAPRVLPGAPAQAHLPGFRHEVSKLERNQSLSWRGRGEAGAIARIDNWSKTVTTGQNWSKIDNWSKTGQR